MQKTHSLHWENNVLEINGVVQVVEVDEKEGQFKLESSTLIVKGSGLNIVKLDKDQGVVVLEVKTITSIGYKQGVSLKGLFR